MADPIRYAGANLYPKQRAAIFDPARISVIFGSVKSGKTQGCLAWLLEQAVLAKQDQNVWWCAPVFSQSEIAFRRMRQQFIRGLAKTQWRQNQSKLTLTLVNGVTLHFRSAERPDDLFGEDVYAVVLDEASRMREEAWQAIRSTLTYTRGPVRIIGNVRGRKNWFYRLGMLAEQGAEGMAFHRLTAWDAVDAGVLKREEIETSFRDFKRLGREGAWRQLYMAEAASDEDNPFGLAAITNCLVAELSSEYPRAAGVDLAGRGAQNTNGGAVDEARGRDYTAVVMLDREGTATHVSRFRKAHTETAEELARIVGHTPALVDSTGTGDAVVEALQRRGDLRVEGFTFTERSRQDLLEGLALAIGEERVHFPDGWLRDELDAFEYRYTPRGVKFSVAEGLHDDGAMSLALAVRKLPWRRRHVVAPTGVAKPGGSTWTENGGVAGAVDPLRSPAAQGAVSEQPAVPMPFAVTGPGAGRWRDR